MYRLCWFNICIIVCQIPVSVTSNILRCINTCLSFT
uniref:Uncharacterized protein n=1 Tax=Anguilla anguilla TaxID=7936 RepID=A0A0E9RSQ5_ANGAN